MTVALPIPNRAGESEFKLQISPDIIIFICNSDKQPVYCDVAIKNTTNIRQTFKVKCTSIELFRVQPPIGFLNAGETMNIRVWFQNKAIPPPDLRHYFAFYHKPCSDKVTQKDAIWNKNTNPGPAGGVKRLPTIFQEKK